MQRSRDDGARVGEEADVVWDWRRACANVPTREDVRQANAPRAAESGAPDSLGWDWIREPMRTL